RSSDLTLSTSPTSLSSSLPPPNQPHGEQHHKDNESEDHATPTPSKIPEQDPLGASLHQQLPPAERRKSTHSTKSTTREHHQQPSESSQSSTKLILPTSANKSHSIGVSKQFGPVAAATDTTTAQVSTAGAR